MSTSIVIDYFAHWFDNNCNKSKSPPFTFHQTQKLDFTLYFLAGCNCVFCCSIWHVWKDVWHFTISRPTQNHKSKNTPNKKNTTHPTKASHHLHGTFLELHHLHRWSSSDIVAERSVWVRWKTPVNFASGFDVMNFCFTVTVMVSHTIDVINKSLNLLINTV